MLDILLIVIFARGLNRAAGRKRQPSQLLASVLIMVGGEIAGACCGFAVGGSPVAVVFAFLGLALGILIAHWRVSALPDLRELDESERPNVGRSLGDQIVGEKCPRCHDSFLSLIEVATCPDCGKAYHSKCLPAHRKKRHAKTHEERRQAARARRRASPGAAFEVLPSATRDRES